MAATFRLTSKLAGLRIWKLLEQPQRFQAKEASIRCCHCSL